MWISNRRSPRLTFLALWLMTGLCSCGVDDEEKSSKARPRDFAYQFGHKINFGIGGEAERFQVDGWSAMESEFTWTNGNVATLGFHLYHSEAPVTLEVTAGAMVHPPELPVQPVDVYVAGEEVANWDVTDFQTFRAILPRKCSSAPETPVLVEFCMPKAVAPAEFDRNGDGRKLGLQVAEVTISKPRKRIPSQHPGTDYNYGRKISFTAGGDAAPFCGTGWSGPEEEFTWTNGSNAVLVFTLPKSAGPAVLYVKAAPMRSAVLSAQPITVAVYGEKIAQWEVADENLFTAVIPKDLLSDRVNVVPIEFSIPRAISPAEIGQGSDARKLGLRVTEVLIAEAPREISTFPNPFK